MKGGHRTNGKPKTSLKVFQANVGKSRPAHRLMLQLAQQQGADIVMIQEPACWYDDRKQISRTITFPGFACHSPVDRWDNARRACPRVLTYVSLKLGVKVSPFAPFQSRDALFLQCNGRVTIANLYRQPADHTLFQQLSAWHPPEGTFIAGDFNAHHRLWQPGVANNAGSADLVAWLEHADLHCTNPLGVRTHESGNVLDLVFTNIPMVETRLAPELECGSDHFPLVSTIPLDEGWAPPTRPMKLPNDPVHLSLFAKHIERAVPRLNVNPRTEQDCEELAAQLSALLYSALRCTGRPARPDGRSNPWWNDETKEAAAHLRILRNMEDIQNDWIKEAKKTLNKAINRATRAFWDDMIEKARSAGVWKITSWYKPKPQLEAPPLLLPNPEGDGMVAISDPEERAQALRKKLLERSTAEDDIPDPWVPTVPRRVIPWEDHLPIDEAYSATCGVGNTSPGADGITVHMLRAAWPHIGEHVRQLFECCMRLGYHPEAFRMADVVFIPKPGKDPSTPKGWRPISLLSCLGKGLERVIARRISWLTVRYRVLNPQQAGALPKRSAVDIVAAFIHDVEMELNAGNCVIVVCTDAEGAFDATQRNRLMLRMREQGWPPNIVRWVGSFMTRRAAAVRFGGIVTAMEPLQCGLPQGSPASPILYLLYTEPVHRLGDEKRNFGYADDCAFYCVGKTPEQARDLAQIRLDERLAWGSANGVGFGPEKTEIQYFTRKQLAAPLPTIRHGSREVAAQDDMRWLGVLLNRKLNFRVHIERMCASAYQAARHIRDLSRVHSGAHPYTITTAMKAIVLPKLFYGAELWWPGPTFLKRKLENGQLKESDTKLKAQLDKMQGVINTALRGCLPYWRTSPLAAIYREASMPPVEQLLEAARSRYSLRLHSLDEDHPLVSRSLEVRLNRRKRPYRPTNLQRAYRVCPDFPRPLLQPPIYTGSMAKDPVTDSKEIAAKKFKEWFATLPPEEIVVFSDGSRTGGEHRRPGEVGHNAQPEPIDPDSDDEHPNTEPQVGFGYVIFQAGLIIEEGFGQLQNAEVFDAEAEGARYALRTAVEIAESLPLRPRITLCLDNSAVLWCLNGTPSDSSQSAFLEAHDLIRQYGNVTTRWSPGHTGITGNELADQLAKKGASRGRLFNQTTTRSHAKRELNAALRRSFQDWWKSNTPSGYEHLKLRASLKPTHELKTLDRQELFWLISARTGHGDFYNYHERFGHTGAITQCICGKRTTPVHIFYCRKTYHKRPGDTPAVPFFTRSYLNRLIGREWWEFIWWAHVTKFFTWVCTLRGTATPWRSYLRSRSKKTFKAYLLDNPHLLDHPSLYLHQKESKRFQRRTMIEHRSSSSSESESARPQRARRPVAQSRLRIGSLAGS